MPFVKAFLPVIFLLTGVAAVVVSIGGIDILGYSIGISLIVVGVLLCVLMPAAVNSTFASFPTASDSSPDDHRRALGHWLGLLVLALIILLLLLGRCAFDGVALSAVIPQGIKLGWTDCSWSALPVWSSVVLGLSLAWACKSLNAAQARALAAGLLVLLVFEILYGHYAWLKADENIFNLGTRVDARYWTGTFGNQNLAAAYMAMSTPLALALMMDRAIISRTWGNVAAVVILAGAASALFSTNSRMGAASAMVGLLILGIGLARQNDDNSRWKMLMIIAAPMVLLLFAGVWLGLDSLLVRYLEVGEGNVSRFKLWEGAFELPLNSWLFGIGAGRFYEVYGIIQPTTLSRGFHYMHNDILQTVMELGIILSIPMIITLFVFVKKWWPRRWSTISIGAGAGCIAGLVQALADFPLRIPGTALVFCCLLGLTFNKSMRERRERDQHTASTRTRRRRRSTVDGATARTS